MNLQSNALKFTEGGSVKIIARLDEEIDGSYLSISVKDTGAGIKIEDQNKLFKMFGYIEDNN